MLCQPSLRSYVVGAETIVPTTNGLYIPSINFNNAATTPPFCSVLNNIISLSPIYTYVNSDSFKSEFVTMLYECGRKVIKEFVNADAERDSVIYTQNTTEAINILSNALLQEDKDQVVLSTTMEHLANQLPWREKFPMDYVETNEYGRLSLFDLDRKLKKYKGKVKLVTVTGAANITGYINPVHEIAKMAHYYNAQILVDAAQLIQHRTIDMKPYDSMEHIDYLAFSAHKMYAPFDSGALIGPKALFEKTDPMIFGAGITKYVTKESLEYIESPAKDEAGSPNIMGVYAMQTAIQTLSHIGMNTIAEHETDLLDYALDRLQEIPEIILYGDSDIRDRVCIIPFNIKGMHHSTVAKILAHDFGISLCNGLCGADIYVQQLLNVSSEEMKLSYQSDSQFKPGIVRISLGLYNEFYEIDRLICALSEIIQNKNQYM